MRTLIPVDRDLLLTLITCTESWALAARLEAIELRKVFADSIRDSERYRDALDRADRALNAVRRADILLNPQVKARPVAEIPESEGVL